MQNLNLVKKSFKEAFHASLLNGDWQPERIPEEPKSELIDLGSALTALENAERVIRMQEEQIRRLEDMALTDELTGLLNRRGFALALQRELSMARRDSGAGGSLVMVDLDGFKAINDMWGHSVGDDYLQTVAHTLLSSVRAGDVVARLGGDEFGILFTRMDEQTCLKRLQKLEQSFNGRVMQVGHEALPLRASFGLSCYSGLDTPETILASADVRLYAQKARRRDRVY